MKIQSSLFVFLLVVHFMWQVKGDCFLTNSQNGVIDKRAEMGM